MIHFITDLAREAGTFAAEKRKKLGRAEISSKESAKDMVTQADKEVEELLIRKIKASYPDHSILGEESGMDDRQNSFCWIIDPIDGTTSYIHGYPFYSVSISVEKEGIPVAGAVYSPVLDELFHAERGGGAYLNGNPISVSDCTSLVEALLATGFACVREDLPENNIPIFSRVMPLIRGIRRSGSAAMDLAYVACGRLDGFWELNLKQYDISAGILLVQEAGGRISDMTGAADYPEQGITATNGKLHNLLIHELNNV